ncbi:MAG TPA: helix-turn-helix domain-containing protein [Propionibacteriaceae bacterium]|nr:helix-turn-helix domain-containing protein [Propionibacteriaceae bacterium]
MTSDSGESFALLASPVRRRIVDTLANLPHVATTSERHTRAAGLTAAELSRRLGLHVTTVRFHVDQLVEQGMLLTWDDRAGVGRPRRHYVINPGTLADVSSPDAYRMLAEILADAMVEEPPVTAEEAGRLWVSRRASEIVGDAPLTQAASAGAWLARIGILVDVLKRWRYSPTVTTSNEGRTAELALVHCPMRELALDNPAVACGVHRGLIEQTMTILGETDAEVSLQPFVESHLCLARITTRATFQPSGGRP